MTISIVRSDIFRWLHVFVGRYGNAEQIEYFGHRWFLEVYIFWWLISLIGEE